jgi:hypothetical protein
MTYFRKDRDIVLRISLILFLTLLSLGSFSPPDADFLTREMDLSHWGMKDPEAVGYLSMGIVHKKTGDELVVYDVRMKKPLIPQPIHPLSRIPPIHDHVFILDDFHRGIPNRLGGYFSPVIRPPSESHVTIEEAPGGRRALCFSYSQKAAGFAGFWIHLFDFKKPPVERIFMDATPFLYLTFSIKGQEGGERLTLQVADQEWEKKEDSLEIGDVGLFLPAGKIQTSWQRAWVPMGKLPDRIKKTELANLVFLARQGKGKVYIGDVAFTEVKDAPIPQPLEEKDFKLSRNRGMWLWNTKDLLGFEEKQVRLVDFCWQNGITEIFLQLPYDVQENDGYRKISWDESAIASLLSRLHKAGIKSHALDGAPQYALREWHDHVLDTIQSVIQYNESVQAEERFDGVRYDNEPYILPAFSGVHKEAILEQYMELLRLSKDLTESAGLEFGVDIPFWFDQKNEFFEPIAQFRRRPLTQCIMDIVDNIGIMDYRTQAYGADGVVAHALDELRYASAKGKKVFIGLETTELPDETLLEFGREKGPSLLFLEKKGGSRILLRWIPEGIDTGRDNHLCLFQQKSVFVPAGKITFAGKSLDELTAVMEKAEAQFHEYPGFYGFAIHYYESFRALTQAEK